MSLCLIDDWSYPAEGNASLKQLDMAAHSASGDEAHYWWTSADPSGSKESHECAESRSCDEVASKKTSVAATVKRG